MELVIRDGEAEDALAIADAHVTAWQVAYRGLFPDDYLDSGQFRESRERGWARHFIDGPPADQGRDERLFVAEVDRRVVGFGNVGRERVDATDANGDSTVAFSDDGELYGFYLHPDAWGSGAGDAMMAACHDALAARFEHAHLWVLRDNPRARRFYERNGWTCGQGEAEELAWWAGPQMPGMPTAPDPVAEIRYSIELR